MVKSDKIANAFKRSEVHRKGKRDKEQEKLKRRMETRKAEAGEGGEELKRVRSFSIIFSLLYLHPIDHREDRRQP
jgi:hypothetical protein